MTRLWRAYRLSREQTLDIVRQRLSNRPGWLIIQAPAEPVAVRRSGLGPGEAAAIALAPEQSADALFIDDRDARREARKHGLIVVGTLRVLADAAEHGFADVGTALNRQANELSRERTPCSTNFSLDTDAKVDTSPS